MVWFFPKRQSKTNTFVIAQKWYVNGLKLQNVPQRPWCVNIMLICEYLQEHKAKWSQHSGEGWVLRQEPPAISCLRGRICHLTLSLLFSKHFSIHLSLHSLQPQVWSHTNQNSYSSRTVLAAASRTWGQEKQIFRGPGCVSPECGSWESWLALLWH